MSLIKPVSDTKRKLRFSIRVVLLLCVQAAHGAVHRNDNRFIQVCYGSVKAEMRHPARLVRAALSIWHVGGTTWHRYCIRGTGFLAFAKLASKCSDDSFWSARCPHSTTRKSTARCWKVSPRAST